MPFFCGNGLANCSIVLTLTLLTSCYSQDSDLKERFLKSYEPASKRLMDYYSHIRLRVRWTNKTHPEKNTKSHEYVYMANTRLFRLDEFEWGGIGIQARVASPKKPSFFVMKEKGSEQFVLSGVMSTDYDARVNFIRQFAPLPAEIFSHCGVLIADYVRYPDIKIIELSPISSASGDRMQLVFERAIANNQKQRGTFIFSSGDWALCEAEIGSFVGQDVSKLRIDYSGKQDGISLVQKSERVNFDRNGKLVETNLVEILEMKNESVPEQEFTLAAFGLSDAGLQPTVAPWFYLQFILVVGFVGAITIWQIARRRSARPLL